jgi:perosamine synthetase
MDEETIRLSDPDISAGELDMVEAVLCAPRLSQGRIVEAFEGEFAKWLGRRHAVAVSSSTLAVWMCLTAWEIRDADEVIASGHSWHQIARGISLAGATPVFADIDYWSGTLSPAKAAEKITDRSRVVLAGNVNAARPCRAARTPADRGLHRVYRLPLRRAHGRHLR